MQGMMPVSYTHLDVYKRQEQLRHNLTWQTVISIAFLLFSPLILGIRNVDIVQSAKVLEMYVALIGIILFVPVFQPEQNQDLRNLISSKYTSIVFIYGIRVILSMLIGGILLLIYMQVMRYGLSLIHIFHSW